MSSIESSRLLMIDRDCPLATNIRHAFGQMGFFVSFTNSALNAVKRLAVEPISAILIGEVSNEIDALKLVKNLRQHPQGRRLPIVLMVTKPDE